MPDRRPTSTDELIAEFAHDNAKRRERDVILDSEIPKMSFAARSENGDVEVTVAWDGVLTGLRIGESNRGADPQLIAEKVARTYATAQQKAASQVADLLAGFRLPKAFIAQRLEERRALEPSVIGETAGHEHGRSSAAAPTTGGGRSDDASDDDFDMNDLRG